jgi:hypothetical protein
VTQVKLYLNLIVTPELKRLAYEKEEARHRRRGSSDASATTEEEDEEKGTERNASIGTGDSKTKKDARDSGDPNGSNITASSNSASLPSSNSNFDDTGSSDGAAHSADVRSPLPRSFPHNYPYISAVSSSSAARPQKSELRTRHRKTSINRRAFLSALGAPSILENPSELSSEEELWLAEMLDAVAAEAGSASLPTFKRSVLP